MNTEVAAELNELRNQVRTLKRMLCGVFGLVVVGGLLAATSLQSVPDVIKAKQFQVVNDEGRVLVQLYKADGENETGLVATHNNKGGRLVRLSSSTNGQGIVQIEDGKGGTLVRLTSNDGGGVVKAMNGKGQPLVALGATAETGGFITTTNDKGQPVVGVSSKDGNGRIYMYNSNREACVRLGALSNGGLIGVLNSIGKPVVTLLAGLNGEGRLTTMDASGTKITSVIP